MDVITTNDNHVVTFTREELRCAMYDEDKLIEFFEDIIRKCAENEVRMARTESEK